jgi:uncharacterized protein (DUF58 family)
MNHDLNSINPNLSIEILAKQLVEGFITGLHKSPYHGFSVEFAEHQLYNEGEATRHIDWKVYARTDKLFTKRYEEETNLRCLIIVDTSASMYYPKPTNAKINFSKYAAAALSYLLHKQRDAVGLCFFNDKIEQLTPIKSSSSHIDKLFKLLQPLDSNTPQHTTSKVASVIHEIAEKIHRRSLVILFSDMFDDAKKEDELFKALQHLKHNKHEVIVFHVMDKKTEQELLLEDRPIEFIDLESGEKVKVNPMDIRESYNVQSGKFFKSLKIKCHQYKIDFIEADVNEGFNGILQSYLIKRSKMR